MALVGLGPAYWRPAWLPRLSKPARPVAAGDSVGPSQTPSPIRITPPATAAIIQDCFAEDCFAEDPGAGGRWLSWVAPDGAINIVSVSAMERWMAGIAAVSAPASASQDAVGCMVVPQIAPSSAFANAVHDAYRSFGSFARTLRSTSETESPNSARNSAMGGGCSP